MITGTVVGNFLRDNRLLLELFFKTLNNFIESPNLKFSKLLFKMFFNDLVEVPQRFAELGIEMVLNTVISPELENGNLVGK